MKNYVIIESSEISEVDFSEVLETSANTLLYNIARTKVVLKFDGDTPSFLEGKTQYTHSEILTILATAEWAGDTPPGE
jgi:hypothetical protein